MQIWREAFRVRAGKAFFRNKSSREMCWKRRAKTDETCAVLWIIEIISRHHLHDFVRLLSNSILMSALERRT